MMYLQSLLIKSIKRYLFWPWPLGNRQLVLKWVLPLVCFESWDLRVLFPGSFLTESAWVGKPPSNLSVCWGSAQETPVFVTGVLEGVSLFFCESVLFMSSWTMLQRLSCWMTCVFTGSDCHVDRTTCSRVCWNIYCKFSEIPYLKSLLLDDSLYVLFLINIKDLMFCSSSEKRPPPKGIKLSMGLCSLC